MVVSGSSLVDIVEIMITEPSRKRFSVQVLDMETPLYCMIIVNVPPAKTLWEIVENKAATSPKHLKITLFVKSSYPILQVVYSEQLR